MFIKRQEFLQAVTWIRFDLDEQTAGKLYDYHAKRNNPALFHTIADWDKINKFNRLVNLKDNYQEFINRLVLSRYRELLLDIDVYSYKDINKKFIKSDLLINIIASDNIVRIANYLGLGTLIAYDENEVIFYNNLLNGGSGYDEI